MSFLNPVIQYAKDKKWETVNFTLIYEHGKEETKTTKEVHPEEILLLPVASQNAQKYKEEEGRVIFMSYAENEQVFIEENHIPPTASPERIQIVMEQFKQM
ncbi:hypothetical protein [uncultured Brevibacillus sp.]|uniref:hypothetical protein n=1 Tax=uncultured Brevibacillus sp. TaxID=169970 RepID=UPI00259237CF|nr:hypothetical protein [uncultured Brevibacillus sp.]